MIKEDDEFVGGKIHEVTLERLKFAMQRAIDSKMLGDIKLKVIVDKFTRDLVCQWRMLIAGQNLRTIQYPKDWWQAFKERWFPKRFKKWWPIEYKIIDIYALYPKIALPKEFTGIHIQEDLFKEGP